ncbi:hypothetical protein STEG23_030961, partial [Scotinomys teguina]
TAALRTKSRFLDPGGWGKTAVVGLYFIFPGICTLSLVSKPPSFQSLAIQAVSDMVSLSWLGPQDKCNEIISWLDKNQTAEKEEFEDQQKELEKVCNPIITKLYQSAGGMPGGMPGGFPGGGVPPSGGASSGPTIEEVD